MHRRWEPRLSNDPFAAENAARLLRATPLAVVKVPPTYTVVLVATIAEALYDRIGLKVEINAPVAVS